MAWYVESPDDAVLLLEEFEGEVYALEVTSFYCEVAWLLGAGGEADGVVGVEEFLGGDVAACVGIVFEGDAFGLQYGEAAVDYLLVELEVGDAEAE